MIEYRINKVDHQPAISRSFCRRKPCNICHIGTLPFSCIPEGVYLQVDILVLDLFIIKSVRRRRNRSFLESYWYVAMNNDDDDDLLINMVFIMSVATYVN